MLKIASPAHHPTAIGNPLPSCCPSRLIVKCPHKAVPSVRSLLNRLAAAQPPSKVEINGVSSTLRKAFSKFCRGNKPHGLGQRL